MTDINWQEIAANWKAGSTKKELERFYVLFGHLKNKFKGSVLEEGVPEAFALSMEGTHAQEMTIRNYHMKGCKILDWHLPKQLTPERAIEMADRADNFGMLHNLLSVLRNSDPQRVVVLESENTVMKKKIAEYEATIKTRTNEQKR